MVAKLTGVSTALWVALATSASAQGWPGLGSGDRISAGRLELADDCPRHARAQMERDAAEYAARRAEVIARALAAGLSQADAEAKANHEVSDVVVTGVGATFAPIVAGVLGDIAAAGVSSAAAALEEASKARAYGVAGVGTFEFYSIGLEDGAVDLQPNFGADSDNACLILRSSAPASPSGTETLYAELALHPVRDGFYVKPVFIEYATPLPGVRTRGPMPAELHVEFSIPGSVADNAYSAKVFGLARIPLPELAPGEIREGPALGVQSELLPFRPEGGSIASARALLTAAGVEGARRSDLIGSRVRFLSRVTGRFDPGIADSSDDDISYVFECDPNSGDAENDVPCRAARTELAELEAKASTADDEGFKAAKADLRTAEAAWLAAAIASQTRPRVGGIDGGSVTVRARLVLVQDENRFGSAIAAALKSRSAAVGTAITDIVTPDTWTEADSTLVKAERKVSRATSALSVARAGGDIAAIQTAEDALLDAKLELNVAAAAAGRRPPYPGLSGLTPTYPEPDRTRMNAALWSVPRRLCLTSDGFWRHGVKQTS